MLFWMRPESHVAAAKIVRSSRRCLIGASFILHRTSSARRHPASRTQQGLDALLESLLHSFVERHFRNSARWSRSDSSWSPDTMPWTPLGAPPSVDHWGRPRARRRPWTTGRSRCPSRASSHRVEVAQRRRRELRARERARDALGARVRLPRHVHGQTLGRVRVRLGARGRGLDELERASRTRERTDPGVGDEPGTFRPLLPPEARVLEAVHARRAPRELRRGRRGNDGVFPSRRAARREDPGVGDEPAPAQALVCIWCRLCERLGELRGLSAPNARPRALPCSKSSASRD